jgi:alkaline phosphatase
MKPTISFKNPFILSGFYLISILLLGSCKSNKTTVVSTYKVIEPTIDRKPKNVVLLIGDGMGLAQIHAAMLSQSDKLNMQSAQTIGFIDTRSADNLITDSGAGGTALACGVRTYNGAIGVTMDTVPVASVLEKAAIKGMSTGIVVSCALTHATPASFYAHKASRDLYDEIATDFYGKNITVAIGGGYANFSIDRLEKEGYKVFTNPSSISKISADKFVAFYNKSFHPPKVSDGRGDFLANGSAKALEVLSTNSNGFFMMIEGSQIDWGGHDNNTDYIVSETLDFDKALGRVLNFAAEDGNTLVIVTADHETGGMSILNDNNNPVQLMAPYSTKNHSGILVPVMAWGPGAAFFSGYMDNTDIAKKIEILLNLD